MEARQEAPLKVCPHCSVATQTDSEVCPSCGGSYARGRRRSRLRWSWWFAVPIVVAAFLAGYFGISRLVDDDDSETGVITLEQARALPASASQVEAEERLGEPVLIESGRSRATACRTPDGGRVDADEVHYYSVSGEEDLLWQLCFRRRELVSSAPVSG